MQAGAKLLPGLDVFGDVWAQPIAKTVGADVGIRILDNVDVFAGAFASLSGEFGATAGVKLRF